ncbi:MAG: phosphatidate cytidylyltransferase [Planctomycetota bacterium]
MLAEWALPAFVFTLLAIATVVGRWLRRQDSPAIDRRAVDSFVARIQSWWFFTGVVALAFFYPTLTVFLFFLISFWSLREFVTLTPTRIGDHRALFWVFFFFTPMQFLLVAFDNYGLYSVLIPVYGFLFIAARAAFAGDFDRFLERIAKVQCALMICVYCLSFAPALLYLRWDVELIDVANGRLPGDFAQAGLLFFFMTTVLLSELLQWVGSRIYGRHVIAPAIDPTRSWEGVVVGALCTAGVGAALSWATPFPRWWQAPAMSLLISTMATAGSLTMSAIKRDRGELTTGNFVEGHGGVLGRIDAICFAAPVFFHVTRYFFGARLD